MINNLVRCSITVTYLKPQSPTLTLPSRITASTVQAYHSCLPSSTNQSLAIIPDTTLPSLRLKPTYPQTP